MVRPTLNTIPSGTSNWDGAVNDNFSNLHTTPLPPAQVADVATLVSTFSAGLYEDCLVVVTGPAKAIYSSDGTNWIPM